MTLIRVFIFFGLSLFISACAIKPKQQLTENNQSTKQQLAEIRQWAVSGRLGIRAPNEANSLSFSWQHTPDQQELLLYGSFGTTYAKLTQVGQLATLELSDNQIYQSDNVEELLLNVLGYPLPVEHLKYWIKGLPYPKDEGVLSYNSLGFLKSIKYKQWTISFKKYQLQESFDNLSLPGKIKVTDGEVTLNLSLRNWQKGTEL